jgi:hypothetical protein
VSEGVGVREGVRVRAREGVGAVGMGPRGL